VIIKVLGSAAGGGFPQANCNCHNCADLRAGKAGLRPRTQSALAVSRGGNEWVLLNASPDLREQINTTPELAPRGVAARSSPIVAVALTGGDVDQVAGLLSLREGLSFKLYASERVLESLSSNSIFNVLDREIVPRLALRPDQAVELPGGLRLEPFAVPGKVALYLEQPHSHVPAREGDTLGVRVSDPATGAAFYYIPACAAIDEALASRLRGAALVLFDGTLYTDDEMIVLGLSRKTGQRMGHISIAGPHGSLAAFERLQVGRHIYVHLNNSNPVLRDDSPERQHIERAGWEVAWDGMEIRL
jgi:pyrroloquinoline quinone biosynthesis protein B